MQADFSAFVLHNICIEANEAEFDEENTITVQHTAQVPQMDTAQVPQVDSVEASDGIDLRNSLLHLFE